MIFIDKMKNLKVYRTECFLPTEKDNKKKKAALLMLTPDYAASMQLMNHPLFINKKRYESYYLDRDVSYYIGSKKLEEVDENFLYLEETKRSELKDSDFGIPEDRKFPLDTEQHVRSAIHLFGHAEESKKKALARRISRKAKVYGIDIPETTQVYKYLHEYLLDTFRDRDTIIFDLGSVLVQDCPKEELIAMISEKYPSCVEDGWFDEVFENVCEMFKTGKFENTDFRTEATYLVNSVSDDVPVEFVTELYKTMILTVKPCDYTVELLNALKESGYKIYYLSNWNKTSWEVNVKMGTFDFLNLMDGGVVSYRVGFQKPNPEIYKIISEIYNLDPSKCIFFDDKQENIDAANEFGWKADVFDADTYKLLFQDIESINESFEPVEHDDNMIGVLDVDDTNILDIKYEIDEKEKRWNSIVIVKGVAPKTLRGRSECIVIKDDEIFLDATEDGICCKANLAKIKYDVPGGGWDPSEPHDICAARETREEAKIDVKDVAYVGSYMSIDKERPEGCYCDGLYSKVYVGKYNGRYKGQVADVDRADIAVSGSWYKIKDVYGDLNPMHQKAIRQYFGDNIEDILDLANYESPVDESYFRDATREELDSASNYIKSVSTDTGTNFYDILEGTEFIIYT